MFISLNFTLNYKAYFCLCVRMVYVYKCVKFVVNCLFDNLLYFTKIVLNIHKRKFHTHICVNCDVCGQSFLTIGNCHNAQLKSARLRNGVNSQMRKVWSLWKIVFLTAAKMPNKKVLGLGMVCGQHVTFGQHCFCVSLLYFTKIILNIHKTRVHTCIFVYCDKVWCLWPMFFFDNCHYVEPKSTYLFFWQLS